jgi:hypothetical protein
MEEKKPDQASFSLPNRTKSGEEKKGFLACLEFKLVAVNRSSQHRKLPFTTI